jgi:hypothetical protein
VRAKVERAYYNRLRTSYVTVGPLFLWFGPNSRYAQIGTLSAATKIRSAFRRSKK